MGLAAGVVLKEEHGGLAEGPFQMSVTDLGSSAARALARTAVFGLRESAVGAEALDALEASDVVDLIQQREAEDAPDTR